MLNLGLDGKPGGPRSIDCLTVNIDYCIECGPEYAILVGHILHTGVVGVNRSVRPFLYGQWRTTVYFALDEDAAECWYPATIEFILVCQRPDAEMIVVAQAAIQRAYEELGGRRCLGEGWIERICRHSSYCHAPIMHKVRRWLRPLPMRHRD